MKLIFVLCAIILVAGVAVAVVTLRATEDYGTFTNAPKVTVSELLDHPTQYQTKTVSIEGTVTQQCQAMGCFFYFEVSPRMLRVDLSDLASSAPRREGHRARVEGRMAPYGDGYQFWASAVAFE